MATLAGEVHRHRGLAVVVQYDEITVGVEHVAIGIGIDVVDVRHHVAHGLISVNNGPKGLGRLGSEWHVAVFAGDTIIVHGRQLVGIHRTSVTADAALGVILDGPFAAGVRVVAHHAVSLGVRAGQVFVVLLVVPDEAAAGGDRVGVAADVAFTASRR